MVRRFAAHYVFPLSAPSVAKGMVETDGEGTILRLHPQGSELEEMAGMIFFNGIICPAFPSRIADLPAEALFDAFPFLQKFRKEMPSGRIGSLQLFGWIRTLQLSGDPTGLEELLCLFILETARALNQTDAGSLEPGKRPGLMLIDRIDYRHLRLSDQSRFKRLI